LRIRESTDVTEFRDIRQFWKLDRYKDGKKVSGIIYLHDISQNRMFGAYRKNLTMFDKLCGDDAVKNVVLATTKWNSVAADVGEQRQRQLSEKYWKTMLGNGSRVSRFKDTHESAWRIVDLILEHQRIDSLQIQRELVDLQKCLPETEAGKILRVMLQELAQKLKVETQEQERDSPTYDAAMQHLSTTLKQVQDLKIPLSRRLAAFVSLKGARKVS
jgi:hypothetical protein